MSIISTRSNNHTQSSSTDVVVSNIDSGDTTIVETFDGSNVPTVKWSVSIIETVTLQTYAFEIFAIHDFSTSVSFNRHNIIGTKMSLIIDCTYGVGNIINLSITNNEANLIRVISKKI